MTSAMNPERRAFVAFLSAALTMRSIPASAQQSTRLRTVGVLMGLANDAEPGTSLASAIPYLRLRENICRY